MLDFAQPKYAATLRLLRSSRIDTPSVSAWRAALRLGMDRIWREKWHNNRERITLADSANLSRWLELADRSNRKWTELKSAYQGETIICAGNGPSLNSMDLTPLNGRVIVGTNRAYKLLEQITPSQFHLVVQDPVRTLEIEKDLAKIDGHIHIGTCGFDEKHTPPAYLSPLPARCSVYLPQCTWAPAESGAYYPSPVWIEGLSTDPRLGLFFGYSVIFSAIQIAAFLGAKRIVCIGIEMDYSQQANFVPGVKLVWPEFNYETHARTMFESLRDELSLRQIELINCTPGGKVDVLKRESLHDACT